MITPKTKIFDILTEFPSLEEKIFSYAPSFKTMTNSSLRNTIARVTTLQQIALSNNLNLSELINDLRRSAGIEDDYTKTNEHMTETTTKPEWLTPEKDITIFDVREMLERGEHPVNQVMSELNSLPEGAVYQIIAPFLPVPLIEKAAGIGFTSWTSKINENQYEIYFYRD